MEEEDGEEELALGRVSKRIQSSSNKVTKEGKNSPLNTTTKRMSIKLHPKPSSIITTETGIKDDEEQNHEKEENNGEM